MRIGLTGGIGSGKSSVARLWAARGAQVVDTDALARELTAPGGAALPALVAAFGADVLDSQGALDRQKMRDRVFADPQARRRLESVLHPMIASRALSMAAAAGPSVVVFDVPLLAESTHWRQRVDRVLVVDCEEHTQVQRVQLRSGWSEQTVRSIISQQASRTLRLSMADAVIFNEQISLQALQLEVDSLWALWAPSPHSAL